MCIALSAAQVFQLCFGFVSRSLATLSTIETQGQKQASFLGSNMSACDECNSVTIKRPLLSSLRSLYEYLSPTLENTVIVDVTGISHSTKCKIYAMC